MDWCACWYFPRLVVAICSSSRMVVMGAVRLYFKLAWQFKTPFIFLMDTRYKTIPFYLIGELCRKIGLTWGEFTDCNAFAWLLKARAIELGINGVGFVIGRHRGWHAWNIALTPYAFYQVEPQNGRRFIKTKGYRPLVIVL